MLTERCSKFVDSHLQPYRCKVNTCENARFSSTACLLRHEREAHSMHGHGEKPFLCTFEGCERGVPGNGFPRHWNLCDHMKRVHNRSPSPPAGPRRMKRDRERRYPSSSSTPRYRPTLRAGLTATPDRSASYRPENARDDYEYSRYDYPP